MTNAGSPRHFHRTHRSGRLHAAVLGANDGVLSMASLMVGMASVGMAPRTRLTAGIAGLAAGMLSMSAGEYVSVSSQADGESGDTEIDRPALQADYAHEQNELADIYVQRGLDAVLARQVAEQLMAHDALAAASASLVSFAAGGVGPLLSAVLASPSRAVAAVIAVASLCSILARGDHGPRARRHRRRVVGILRRHQTPADALPHLAAGKVQLAFIEIPAEID
ncbi:MULTISPECIES: VIT1/CCC1 transporter family protein [Burkholderia]|uniref:VIT1/CCC1 transporter family protein n=1 Tax=Burkholderia anthina TaxID=179879 RepID=A0A7T6VIW8_9BURK|nr:MULTISPECIES: VIT1/CCC1 transporter family protein [Burkholderia]MBY4868545.1 VIT1/CCC1 transporter family protein [Burkholderia anthina]QQK04586.1 VIT1/CCC1 transporter family protein [Burkholderia anthina]